MSLAVIPVQGSVADPKRSVEWPEELSDDWVERFHSFYDASVFLEDERKLSAVSNKECRGKIWSADCWSANEAKHIPVQVVIWS